MSRIPSVRISRWSTESAAGGNERGQSRIAVGGEAFVEPAALGDVRSGRWRELQSCVAALLESACGVHIPAEKRTHRRHAFRRPLTITPVNNNTGRPDELKSFSAFGIDLSPTGIGFLARQLVPARKAIVSCDAANARTVSLLFEPRWVRFTRGGWYQTGGRLVEVLPDQMAPAPPCLRLLEMPDDIEAIAESVSRESR